jgi:hypothetical protein
MRKILMAVVTAAVLLTGYAIAGPASASGYWSRIRERDDPVHVRLRGIQETKWARNALWHLGAPRTHANIRTMKLWFRNEGTPHDFNNPLNLQTPVHRSHVSTADGDPPEDRIQAYRHPWDAGIAFGIEMRNGSYDAIVARLMSGRGLIGEQSREIRDELSVYSGDGYDSIPAAYCPC